MGLMKYLREAQAELNAMGEEFACIENAPGIFPPREIVPLGPKLLRLDGPPAAIFLDMDGTTTYTEPLFLHDVEVVVRRSTGWHTKAEWAGIDPERDYPNIIGYSTLRNLEYLYGAVGHAIRPDLFFQETLRSLIFLAEHHVPQDIHDRIESMTNLFGMAAWRAYAANPQRSLEGGEALIREGVERFPAISQEMFAQFGLMIFYGDYIDILERVNRGEGAAVSQLIYGDPAVPAINAMPGVALLCTLAKGWLPEASAAEVARAVQQAHPTIPVAGDLGETLARLCRLFAKHPVPVALVTSSGSHETNLVLQAVFLAIRHEIAAWPLEDATRAAILAGFESHTRYFDTIVTCDDVNEGRTKPFRDPYTLALARLGLEGRDARRVIGFEDTEAGIIAQRGAGVGIPCTVPIEHTLGHDFQAAAHVLHGGVLEAITKHGLFIA